MQSGLPDGKVKRQFVDGEFGQVHFRTCGQLSEKPSVICLHMVSKSSRQYHNILPLLGKDRLAVAIDYPGYGESEAPATAADATIEAYAKTVFTVLDALGLTRVNFVGYHTGCMVSVEASLLRPELVEKVINFGAPIFTPEEVTDFIAFFAPVPLDEQGTRFRTMWERIMFYRGPGMTLEMAADSMAENLRGGDKYEWGHVAAFNHAKQYAEGVAKLPQPFFVMNVNDDLYQHSRRVDGLLNNGIRKDFPDWGTGFLDVFKTQAAYEILRFFDTDSPI